MLLIGMFDSPYVRRVAIGMKLCGIAFEHASWSVGAEFERIAKYNPLVRVPTLVLDSGEVLLESAALLDYLDELVGPQRALLPRAGPERRSALKLMALASGAADKGRDQIYERAFRPADKRHDRWLIGERLTHADITLACAFTFLCDALNANQNGLTYPALGALAQRCEALPEFLATRVEFIAPNS
jgi:glutathione S-transferase